MTPPLVSVLIPTYNRAQYLRDALVSALGQTYASIEVVVLDDASTDATPDVCAEFAPDSRLRVVRHQRNLGLVGNWRYGVSNCDGKYFCLLHDDDVADPAFVMTLVTRLEQDEQLILAFCDHRVIDSDGCILGDATAACSRKFRRDRLRDGRLPDFARSAVVDRSIPVVSTVFRRSAVPSTAFDDRAGGAADLWLFYQCVRTGLAAHYVAQELLSYRLHSGGMSASRPIAMEEGWIYCWRNALDDPSFVHLREEIAERLGRALEDYALDLLTSGQCSRARAAATESLRYGRGRRRKIVAQLTALGVPGAMAARLIRFLKRRVSQASAWDDSML